MQHILRQVLDRLTLSLLRRSVWYFTLSNARWFYLSGDVTGGSNGGMCRSGAMVCARDGVRWHASKEELVPQSSLDSCGKIRYRENCCCSRTINERLLKTTNINSATRVSDQRLFSHHLNSKLLFLLQYAVQRLPLRTGVNIKTQRSSCLTTTNYCQLLIVILSNRICLVCLSETLWRQNVSP